VVLDPGWIAGLCVRLCDWDNKVEGNDEVVLDPGWIAGLCVRLCDGITK
jgi:hypothetical protein